MLRLFIKKITPKTINNIPILFPLNIKLYFKVCF